mmetsp:Transcript_32327/g.84774  ORF Transcript_32327/g.84774 Transcript_32327/m.84774 type:complete len:306 (+) Transcript_32327:113-1030(+)
MTMTNGSVALSQCVWAQAHVANVHWEMCTYPSKMDRWISASVQSTGCWLECADVQWMLEILDRYPQSEVLDIGGNIGFYSLAAAAAGHHVSVFEPSPDNIGHLLASIRRNMFRTVRVFALCVSDGASPCEINGHRDNQGALQHMMRHTGADSLGRLTSRPSGWRRGMVTTMAVRIDNVLSPRQRPLFIKIDVEGGECEAFRGMPKLLNDSHVFGALVEFDKSHKCCQELISKSTRGAFWMLHHQHGLCAYQAPARKPAHTRPTPLGGLCELHGASKQLNIRWQPCESTARNELGSSLATTGSSSG